MLWIALPNILGAGGGPGVFSLLCVGSWAELSKNPGILIEMKEISFRGVNPIGRPDPMLFVPDFLEKV